jgi:hypothetical protein
VWEAVEIKQSARRSGEAFASIGQGRVSLNADACDLIDNIYDYGYVDVSKAKEGISSDNRAKIYKKEITKFPPCYKAEI